MRLVKTIVILAFLASACSSPNLVVTGNAKIGPSYPMWLPDQLKIEALSKATFELLWEPGGKFQFIRANIPWGRTPTFLGNDG